jgi:hypothetical protein
MKNPNLLGKKKATPAVGYGDLLGHKVQYIKGTKIRIPPGSVMFVGSDAWKARQARLSQISTVQSSSGDASKTTRSTKSWSPPGHKKKSPTRGKAGTLHENCLNLGFSCGGTMVILNINGGMWPNEKS